MRVGDGVRRRSMISKKRVLPLSSHSNLNVSFIYSNPRFHLISIAVAQLSLLLTHPTAMSKQLAPADLDGYCCVYD